MNNNKDNIYDNCTYYIYWENRDKKNTPVLVKKCIEKFKKKCRKLVILTNHNINKYIDTVSTKNIKHIAQKADYYRAKILYTYGGIWCDIDTIMLNSLDDEWSTFYNSDKEVCVSTCELNSKKPAVCIQYLMAKKQSIIFKKWVERCENMIESNEKFGWADIGGYLLAKVILENNFQNLIYPFPNEVTFRYGASNYTKYYITDKTTVENEAKRIKNYKIIILYGTFMYNKHIPKTSVLDMFLNI